MTNLGRAISTTFHSWSCSRRYQLTMKGRREACPGVSWLPLSSPEALHSIVPGLESSNGQSRCLYGSSAAFKGVELQPQLFVWKFLWVNLLSLISRKCLDLLMSTHIDLVIWLSMVIHILAIDARITMQIVLIFRQSVLLQLGHLRWFKPGWD